MKKSHKKTFSRSRQSKQQKNPTKKQHLIPQTYMSAWANNNKKVKVENVKNKQTAIRRTDKILYKDYQYSYRAGMSGCTQDMTNRFFSPLSNLIVKISGIVVTDTMKMNDNWDYFDEWEITDKDETQINAEDREVLKREIENVIDNTIEDHWSKEYENHWKSIVKEIEEKILDPSFTSVPAFKKEDLLSFISALAIRQYGHIKGCEIVISIAEDLFKKLFQSELDLVDQYADNNYSQLPNKNVSSPQPITSNLSEHFNFRHDFYQYQYKKDKDMNGGLIEKLRMLLHDLTFQFYVCNESNYFITSDHPVIIGKSCKGHLAALFPITPRIALVLKHTPDDISRYYIFHISGRVVDSFNAEIRRYAQKLVIYPMNQD